MPAAMSNHWKTLPLLLLCLACAAEAQSLREKIVHYSHDNLRNIPHVHAGAGSLNYTALYQRPTYASKFLFLHRGQLMPKSSIGRHYHNRMEEMFVILDGKAEFTIDGRTSALDGPAGAPCRMGSVHGIYNPTDEPVEWMNIAVTSIRGEYDAFDMGDDGVGAPLDKKPIFMNMQLRKENTKPMEKMYGGKGTALYRRALPHQVFKSDWAYADHLILPPGASLGKHLHRGVEELHYVIRGAGSLHVNDEQAPFAKDDALFIEYGQAHSIENTGSEEMELLIIGVALEKDRVDVEPVE